MKSDIFTDEELHNIYELLEVLKAIHIRLITEGCSIDELREECHAARKLV